MRTREVLALLQHPSVPRHAVVLPGTSTVEQLLKEYAAAPEEVLDEPGRLAGGEEVGAVYLGDTKLQMSDPL